MLFLCCFNNMCANFGATCVLIQMVDGQNLRQRQNLASNTRKIKITTTKTTIINESPFDGISTPAKRRPLIALRQSPTSSSVHKRRKEINNHSKVNDKNSSSQDANVLRNHRPNFTPPGNGRNVLNPRVRLRSTTASVTSTSTTTTR